MIKVKIEYGNLFGQEDHKAINIIVGDTVTKSTRDVLLPINGLGIKVLKKLEQSEADFLFTELSRLINLCINHLEHNCDRGNEYEPPLAEIIKKRLFGEQI